MLPPLANHTSPFYQSLSELVSGLGSGTVKSVEIVQFCIDQINTLDRQVQAWVSVDAEGAMKLAAESDQRRSKGRPKSLLDGIPVGIKDIIDVSGWPTAAGFEPWKQKIAKSDAKIVSQMRSAGIIPLGKTVTTQFASIDPPPTRNPWNLDRTPGGSSSGSCAAVACRMVPLALGSQTGGSINRPASYCGVVGLKMTYSEWPTAGVIPCSIGLDTLGPIVPSVEDILLVYEVLPGAFDSDKHRFGFQEGLKSHHKKPLKVLRLGGKFQALAESEMLSAVGQAEDLLKSAGCQVSFEDASDFFNDELWETHRRIMMAECFLSHELRFAKYPEFYLPKIRGWVEAGQKISESSLDEEPLRRGRLIHDFTTRFGEFDAILVPAARGEAPTPETTGDPVFNSPWTLLAVPSLTVPIELSSQGLPLGVQLVSTKIGGTGFGRMLAAGRILDK